MFKRHYNIVVIACCFLFMFVNVGLASTSFSVHQPYIVAIDGIGDGSGSIILSVNKFVAILAMCMVERYYRFLGDRKGVFFATLCTTCGFIAYSSANTLPGFMLGSFFTGFGYGLGGMVAVTYIINRWFESGIGTAIGIAAVGSGLCAIFMPYVVTHIIEGASLTSAFIFEAIISLIVGILMLLVLRDSPEQLGVSKFSLNKTDKRLAPDAADVCKPTSFDHWLLFVALIGVGVFSGGGTAFISVLATSNGFGPLVAATLVSCIGIAMTIGKVVLGEVFDKWGIPLGTLLIFGLGVAGYALCCTAPLGSTALLVCGAILVGIGMVSGSVGLSVWSIDFSTPETRSKEIRNFQICFQTGSFLGNLFPGIVKDLVGTYVVSYAAIGVVGFMAFIVIMRYYRTYRANSK